MVEPAKKIGYPYCMGFVRPFSYLLALIALFAATGCATMPFSATRGPGRPIAAAHTYLIHAPGMGGWMPADSDWLHGMADAGVSDHVEVYDWTGSHFLIGAVLDYADNRKAAQYLAERIADKLDDDPDAQIVLTGWSAGAATTLWALEDLPDDVQVQSVMLVQPAIDPDHDLSRALRHVRGHLFSIQSAGDVIVLGIGTFLFGTADGGVHTAAAGQVGFRQPPGSDREQYAKLVPVPYKLEWLGYGNFGEHVGPMAHGMAKEVLGPMLVGDGEGKSPR